MENNIFEESFFNCVSEKPGTSWSNGDRVFDAGVNLDFRRADPLKLAAFLQEAASAVNERGLISLFDHDDPAMPRDARVGILYQPTYAILAAAICLHNTHPELIGKELWDKYTGLMNAAFCCGIVGHGFEEDELKCKVALMMCAAGVREYIESGTDEPNDLSCYFLAYAEQHRRLGEECAREDAPDGQILCFHDFCGTRCNAYIQQFNAAWNGMPHTVFVYGTLMKNERAHHELDGAYCLGKYSLRGYRMYNLGSYPGIKATEKTSDLPGQVQGEVYCVDDETLARLDAYEGEGSLYTRKAVTVKGEYGAVRALVYEYNGPVSERAAIEGWPVRQSRSEDERVWYACYGSNLQEKRFRCYIQGGTCAENGRYYDGCRDKSLWTDSKVRFFPGRMYFGNHSSSWNNGGVAFYDEEAEGGTLMRMYKITRGQLNDVQKQEGPSPSWYGRRVLLGVDADGIPVYTLTSESRRPQTRPDEAYLQLIRNALVNECKMKKGRTEKYLKDCLREML